MWNRVAIVVAVILGVMAIVLVRSYMEKQIKQVKGEEVDVVAAARTIEAGETITFDMLGKRRIPKKWLFEKCVLGRDFQTILGRQIKYDVTRGQLLAWPMFREEQKKEVALVPRGFRGYTIAVTEVTGVGGHLKVGSKVDIIGTFFLSDQDTLTVTEPEKRRPTTKTVTLMQNVQVLALARQTVGAQFSSKEKERYGTVTLALTPLECELLAYTDNIGRIQLVLRNPNEPYILEEEGEPRKVSDEVLLELIQSASKIRARHVK